MALFTSALARAHTWFTFKVELGSLYSVESSFTELRKSGVTAGASPVARMARVTTGIAEVFLPGTRGKFIYPSATATPATGIKKKNIPPLNATPSNRPATTNKTFAINMDSLYSRKDLYSMVEASAPNTRWLIQAPIKGVKAPFSPIFRPILSKI